VRIAVDYGNLLERSIALGEYKRDAVDFFEEALETGDVVVDVGANVGYYTLVASKNVGPSGQVYAFEPLTKNFNRLIENLGRNDADNVVTFNCGLAEEGGTATMHLPKGKPEEATLSKTTWSEITKGNSERKTTEEVELVIFDEIDEVGAIDFIKIDVEGAEFSVLRSMEQTLKESENIDLLLVVHLPQLAEFGKEVGDVLSLLSSCGFERAYSITSETTHDIETLRDHPERFVGPNDFLVIQKATSD
jgi:FkbM family methyltransferase